LCKIDLHQGESGMSDKHILIVNGSPRKNGNSVILAEQVAAGARAAGAQVESFFLQNMNIQPCNACDACQETSDGDCIIQDDMQTLYPKLRRADAIVIASPIYWFTFNAQTKLFIDRWYALQGSSGNVLAGKQIGVVLTYGDTDPFTSGAVNAIRTFQDICRYIGADMAGIVYGSATKEGEIRDQPDLLERAFKLGQQLATT
jgi:multimeric flavodoxin WrbA